MDPLDQTPAIIALTIVLTPLIVTFIASQIYGRQG